VSLKFLAIRHVNRDRFYYLLLFIKVDVERYQEVMVALSETAMKNCLKRHLAEKSPWRHTRLAIKPRYLGNHALQIKSYYGTLSGSHGRSFRIRHEN